MAQAPSTEAAGTAGESFVQARLQRLGFGVIGNPKHDLGIDLFIMVRDARRFDRLILMMAQSKAGDSQFNTPEYDGDGYLRGWWYAEPDAEHFDDWVQHRSAHILVLTDLDTELSYWVQVAREAMVSTGKGHKILVPAANVLTNDSRDQLLEVAETGLLIPSLQGTSFSASVNAAGPARVLRHALLTPRLIAPHPNAIAGRELEPEESIALVASGRVDELRRVAEASQRKIKDAGEGSKDWRWRFFAAFSAYTRDHDPEPLRVLALVSLTAERDKQPLERTAAVAVAAAAAQSESGNWQTAAEILALTSDHLAPVDHGWVLVWRALAAAELGRPDEARALAAQALRTVALDQEDPTAAAIAAAAAAFIFRVTAWSEEESGVSLSQLLTSNDTAASWWRDQATSWSMREQDDFAFREWAGRSESAELLEGSLERLRAVAVSALLAGDIGASAAAGELWSTSVVRARSAQPWPTSEQAQQSEFVLALDGLRHTGRAATLSLAVDRLWRDGPLEPVADCLTRARARGWSPATARAHLSLLQAAGDLLAELEANAAVADLLRMIAEPQVFADSVRASFDPRYFGLLALATVIPAASPQVQAAALAAVLELLTQEADPHPTIIFGPVLAVVRCAADQAVLQVEQPLLDMAAADIDQPPKRWATLHTLRAAGSSLATEQVAAGISGDDPAALENLQDFELLKTDGLLKIIEGEASTCAELAAEAVAIGPSFGGGGRAAGRLAAANLRAPEHASWAPLHGLLATPQATGESKSLALTIMLTQWDLVPENERSDLRELYRSSDGFAADPGLSRPEPYEALTMAIGYVLGEVTEAELRRSILTWLTGDTIRRHASASLLDRLSGGLSVDLREMLCADPDVVIRAAAAPGLLEVASDDPRLSEAMNIAIDGPGCSVALAVAQRLAARAVYSSDLAAQAIARLQSHESARVRKLANRARARADLESSK